MPHRQEKLSDMLCNVHMSERRRTFTLLKALQTGVDLFHWVRAIIDFNPGIALVELTFHSTREDTPCHSQSIS